MVGRRRDEVPARLQRLQQRFAAWRKSRRRGERIPKTLWRTAARLATEYGLHRVSSVLKLDFYSLQKHVDRQQADSAPPTAAFVELCSPSMPFASECVIELEDGIGSRLRVHLKGAEVPDVLALARGFWDAE